MPRARRHITALPSLRLTPQLKLNRATVDHNIAVFEPVLVPIPSVDLDRLYEIAVGVVQIRGRDAQSTVPIDGHVDILEPGRVDQIDRLCDNRIKPYHLPDEPGIKGAGIAVARDAVVCVLEAVETSAERFCEM